MISLLRRSLDTWPVRAFFGVMVIAFVVWGIGGALSGVGRKTWLVKVGGETIEPQQFQPAFQRDLAKAQQKVPPGQDMTATQRRDVANQALEQMIGQVAMTEEERRLRVIVPDAVVRAAVFGMPAFRDKAGKFDHDRLVSLLRSNGLSEPEFISIVRGDLARGQILDAVAAGAAPPATLIDAVYAFETEQRSAAMVELPFAAAPPPPPPTDAELTRWYANNPADFRIPEYRTIKAIILSSETIAKTLSASDADLRAWYDSHQSQFSEPATRSIEVAVVPDKAKADALAALWKGGADFAAMQKAAEAAGGSAVALDKSTALQIPDAGLAKAAFTATPREVTGPIQASLGWAVFEVTAATQGQQQDFAAAKEAVRKQLLLDRASSMLYDRVTKVDDVLGTGTGLDKLPGDLGLAGVSGTLDADGNTDAGTPAPIPGSPALRQAIVAAAFSHQPGPPSEMTEVNTPGAGSAFYAVEVEKIIPPGLKPFNTVKPKVTQDWIQAALIKEQEKAAAAMLTAVHGGESLADAAAKAGTVVFDTPLATRDASVDGMPPQLQQVLFGLKPKEPTMVQTQTAFIVALPARIETPDPKTDPSRRDAVRDVLTRSTASDLAESFAQALRARADPTINQTALAQFAQQ